MGRCACPVYRPPVRTFGSLAPAAAAAMEPAALNWTRLFLFCTASLRAILFLLTAAAAVVLGFRLPGLSCMCAAAVMRGRNHAQQWQVQNHLLGNVILLFIAVCIHQAVAGVVAREDQRKWLVERLDRVWAFCFVTANQPWVGILLLDPAVVALDEDLELRG